MINEKDSKPNNFTPVIGAMNLADYVILITDNANKFPDYYEKKIKDGDGKMIALMIQRQDSLVNWVREQAKEIFLLTYTANEINLTKEPWRKEERLSKQINAIRLCGKHLAAIQLCKKHFGLSNRKVKHWGEQVRKLRESIKGWHESDKDRYKNI